MRLANRDKAHLWRLPDYDRYGFDYPGESAEQIMIFPLFQVIHNNRISDASLEHHIVKAGVWARRSWLKNSDARDEDIPIKFYVEEQVRNRVLRLLKKNGIGEQHVLFFDGSAFEGYPQTHLGKKLAFCTDSQFSSYEWVHQVDVDCFMACRGQLTEPYPFFKFFESRTPDFGSVDNRLTHRHNSSKSIIDFHWINWIIDGDDRQAKADEWIKRAAHLTSSKIAKKYLDDSIKPQVHGAIYHLPARHFHTNQPESLRWLAKAGKLLQDDEAVASLWAQNGNVLFNSSKEMGIDFITRPRDFSYTGRLVREPPTGAYISHIGNCEDDGFDESQWRIDCAIPPL